MLQVEISSSVQKKWKFQQKMEGPVVQQVSVIFNPGRESLPPPLTSSLGTALIDRSTGRNRGRESA